MSEAIKNRYEFMILFDVENGNPNGDPDAGNLPRIDPESGYGIVTDVCLKRKSRNYVETLKEDEAGYRIYIKEGIPLNRSDSEACAYLGLDEKGIKDAKKKDPDVDVKIRDFMCRNFFDIRTFGAVMTTFVPYALYRTEGYISANLARRVTGFSEEDLELLWQAIINMFEIDHSAARGNMSVRELIVFKHSTELGNCPAYKLFDSVEIKKKDGVGAARRFSDYTVTIHEDQIPDSVEVIRKI